AYHPKEQGRLEFKAFDTPADRADFLPFFLLWLWLVLDEDASGEADEQDRVYDLAEVARLGWQAEGVAARARGGLGPAGPVPASLGGNPSPLERLRGRLEARWVPADALIRRMKADPSIPGLLRFLDQAADGPRTPTRTGGITSTAV